MVNYVSAEEAAKLIKSGDRVLVQAASATLQTLLKAMTARGLQNFGMRKQSLYFGNYRLTEIHLN